MTSGREVADAGLPHHPTHPRRNPSHPLMMEKFVARQCCGVVTYAL
jgi:hypothetical protein